MTKILSFDILSLADQANLARPPLDNQSQIERLKRAARHALTDCLTEKQYQVVSLYFFEGYNTVEIAKKLGKNKSTVSRTLHAAIGRLQKVLKYYVD